MAKLWCIKLWLQVTMDKQQREGDIISILNNKHNKRENAVGNSRVINIFTPAPLSSSFE